MTGCCPPTADPEGLGDSSTPQGGISSKHVLQQVISHDQYISAALPVLETWVSFNISARCL